MTGLKEKQILFYRESVDAEFEIARPDGCGRLYNYLMSYKIDGGLRRVPFSLRDRNVLDACCGSGMAMEFLSRTGATVFGMDLSKDAVLRARERARRHGFDARFVVGDAENLPFLDSAVDVSFVHDGLHHLSAPYQAIRELSRAARRAVLLVEPANAAITRVAVTLGLAQAQEDAGNYVNRLSKAELIAVFRDIGVRSVMVRRYCMYYHHEPKWYYRIFDNSVVFRLFQAAFLLTNLVLGRWGNKIMCLAVKTDEEQKASPRSPLAAIE